MIEESIIICGVVKNCGNRLKFNIDLALDTGKRFRKFKIIIYENNSTDNTKDVLRLYENCDDMVIISEDISPEKMRAESKIWAYTEITGSDHPCRIEQICNARNIVINEFNKPGYNKYKYVMWIDMDSQGWDIDGIADSFNCKNDWDVVYANGIERGAYYDYYALRADNYLFGPEIIGDYFWNNIKRSTFHFSGLMRVYSAFGGLGIMKKNIFKTFKYDCIVNDDVKKFYREHIAASNTEKIKLELIAKPCTKFPGGYKDAVANIFWKNNSGYDAPVICEHVAFNLALYNNDYRIYMNPNMIYKR